MKYLIFFNILFSILFFVFCEISFSDIIKLKDGSEEKGIVVEEYSDRIVLSQEKGETQILKENIKEILYDTKEQNLLVLGNLYKEKGNLDKALEYYKKALSENPYFKEAKDAIGLVSTLKLREKEIKKMEEVRRKAEPSGAVILTQHPQRKTPKDEIKEKIGIIFNKGKEGILVTQIIKDSPAQNAGLKNGDLIISIWGSLIGYSSEEEIERFLLEPKYKELKFIVQREISPQADPLSKSLEDSLGFAIRLDEEGFKVQDVLEESPAQKAGLETGDFIHMINDESVRYMNLEKAKNLMHTKAKEGTLRLMVRKEISLIRKE
ncbi:MAG: PDZ domain-containing protein [Candidatus Omnitrophica bacterium]|nr:PDZ domain-containing protein [Candidatus Omnitrophota bacterium]